MRRFQDRFTLRDIAQAGTPLPARERGVPAAILSAAVVSGMALLLLFSTLAEAADAGHAADAHAGRSHGDMTVEERAELMQATNAYNRCVYEAAMGHLDSSPDVRAIADMAFDDCTESLEGMRRWFADNGFDAGAAEGYTTQMKNRAGRKVLPELMLRKSGS